VGDIQFLCSNTCIYFLLICFGCYLYYCYFIVAVTERCIRAWKCQKISQKRKRALATWEEKNKIGVCVCVCVCVCVLFGLFYFASLYSGCFIFHGVLFVLFVLLCFIMFYYVLLCFIMFYYTLACFGLVWFDLVLVCCCCVALFVQLPRLVCLFACSLVLSIFCCSVH